MRLLLGNPGIKAFAYIAFYSRHHSIVAVHWPRGLCSSEEINNKPLIKDSRKMASVKKLIFQRAKIDDIKEVRAMIQELADFEKMSDGPKLTEEELSRDSGLTGEEERIHTYILKLKQDNQTELTPIGMAICYFTYSTWEGRAYFLEDFYVRPEYRGIGGGKRIFQEVAAKAKEFGCKRLDFHVLKWNPARKFYAAMGAVDVTDTDEWHYYRLFETQIDELSRKLQLEEENRK